MVKGSSDGEKLDVRVIFYNGKIDEPDKVSAFIKELSEAVKENDKVVVCLASEGGRADLMTPIKLALINYKDQVHLHGHDNLCSAAFEIFHDFPGSRSIDPYTFVMIHIGSSPVTTRELLDENSADRYLLDLVLRENESHLRKYGYLMNEKQIEDFRKGKDVHLDAGLIRDRCIYRLHEQQEVEANEDEDKRQDTERSQHAG